LQWSNIQFKGMEKGGKRPLSLNTRGHAKGTASHKVDKRKRNGNVENKSGRGQEIGEGSKHGQGALTHTVNIKTVKDQCVTNSIRKLEKPGGKNRVKDK